MPITIIPKDLFHFGTGFDAARLPDGWKLEESQEDWAQAIDPDGKRYMLGQGRAWPITSKHQESITVSLGFPVPLKGFCEDDLKTRS